MLPAAIARARSLVMPIESSRSGVPRGEVIAQRAKIGEGARGVSRGFSWGGAERSNCHQAIDAEVSFRLGGGEEPRGVGEVGAKFSGVAAGVDLEEDREDLAEFGCSAVQLVEEFLAVDALHAVEVLDGEFRLVGL